MKAFVISAPGQGEVVELAEPRPGPDEVVVEVERVGVCGTDIEFFHGSMAYLHTGEARYPMRIGHEWCGVVCGVGSEVDRSWIGRRVVGDTMLGCGHCDRCADERWHLCANRSEVGIRNGRPGALAEQLAVPVSSLHGLTDAIDPTLGALIEPGANALRAVRAASLAPGARALVVGPGTIGLLTAMLAVVLDVEVHVLGIPGPSLEFARTFDFAGTWTADDLPNLGFDAVIDASGGSEVPAQAIELVEPGRRVVLVGLAGTPSVVDSRRIALQELTVVGLLGGSDALAGTIELYASGKVDPRDIVAATSGLRDAAMVLAGKRPAGAGPGPKFHFDPQLRPESSGLLG